MRAPNEQEFNDSELLARIVSWSTRYNDVMSRITTSISPWLAERITVNSEVAALEVEKTKLFEEINVRMDAIFFALWVQDPGFEVRFFNEFLDVHRKQEDQILKDCSNDLLKIYIDKNQNFLEESKNPEEIKRILSRLGRIVAKNNKITSEQKGLALADVVFVLLDLNLHVDADYQMRLAEQYLRIGGNLEIEDAFGDTPLIICCRETGRERIVIRNYLIAAGADVLHKGTSKKSALDWMLVELSANRPKHSNNAGLHLILEHNPNLPTEELERVLCRSITQHRGEEFIKYVTEKLLSRTGWKNYALIGACQEFDTIWDQCLGNAEHLASTMLLSLKFYLLSLNRVLLTEIFATVPISNPVRVTRMFSLLIVDKRLHTATRRSDDGVLFYLARNPAICEVLLNNSEQIIATLAARTDYMGRTKLPLDKVMSDIDLIKACLKKRDDEPYTVMQTAGLYGNVAFMLFCLKVLAPELKSADFNHQISMVLLSIASTDPKKLAPIMQYLSEITNTWDPRVFYLSYEATLLQQLNAKLYPEAELTTANMLSAFKKYVTDAASDLMQAPGTLSDGVRSRLIG